jgi:ABC-type glycerol-3-phosphate transport system substrate-binding protein
MSTKRSVIAVLSVVVLAAAPSLRAQMAGAAPAGGSAEVQVWSGGVGEGAREALEEQAQGANLKLEFATPDGHYLADVKVVIQSRGGQTVLETISEGPWAYVRLPAGRYTVTASTTVSRQAKAVGVSVGRRSTLLFHLRAE